MEGEKKWKNKGEGKKKKKSNPNHPLLGHRGNWV